MSLPLTPALLRAAYEYLRATPPFRGWGMPTGSAVKFQVLRTKDRHGDHYGFVGQPGHVIRISAGRIGRTHSLMEVMAHEMIHARQQERKTYTANTQHNAEFHKLAAVVCKVHGFEPKLFT